MNYVWYTDLQKDFVLMSLVLIVYVLLSAVLLGVV